MSLTHIEYGSLASSEVMNDNFEYLDDRITSVAGSLTSVSTSINSSIAGMNSTFSESISDIESTLSDLETDVEEVRNDFYSAYYTPNYSNAIAMNYSKGDVVGFNGWLAVHFRSHTADNSVVIKINDIPVGGIRTGSSNAAVDENACIVLVKEDDVIDWTGTISGSLSFINFYKIPFLGGQ